MTRWGVRRIAAAALLWLGLALPIAADAPAWQSASPELDGHHVHDLAVSPVDGRQVLAGGELGIYRTLDGGDTWSPFNQGIATAHRPILRLTQHATAPWTVYAASEDALYRWREGEATWQNITSRLPAAGSRICGLTAAPSDQGRLYAVLEGLDHWLLVSYDWGDAWIQRPGNLAQNGWRLPGAQPLGNSIVVAAHDPELLMHAQSPATPQILLSSNAGVTWAAYSLPGGGVYALDMAHQGAPWPAFAGTSGAGVYARASATDPWLAASTNLPGNGADDVIRAIAVHPAAPEHVLAGVDGHGVYRTLDGGAWWEPFGEGLPEDAGLRIYRLNWGTGGGSLLWAATNDGVWHITGTPLYLPALWRQSAP